MFKRKHKSKIFNTLHPPNVNQTSYSPTNMKIFMRKKIDNNHHRQLTWVGMANPNVNILIINRKRVLEQ